MDDGETSLTMEAGDIINVRGTCTDAGDEWVAAQRDIADISSELYTKFVVRWRTETASNGLGARVDLVFGDAGEQTIVGVAAPEFSTTWKVSTGTIVAPGADKDIAHIRLAADDNPDAKADGGFSVYYDFIMLCQGIFAFPHVAPGGVRLETPMKTVELDAPSREGGHLQRLGMKSPIIILSGDMEYDDSVDLVGWRPSGTGEYGERLFKIIRDSDPWQWLTSDIINCKVTPDTNPFFIEQRNNPEDAQRLWGLRFKQYSLSSLGETWWVNKQWYGK